MQYRRTTRSLNHRWLIIKLLLLLLTFVGCTIAPQNIEGDESVVSVAGMTATITATIIPATATPIVSRTPTLTATVEPSLTATPTLVPTTTPSPSSTPLPTPAPLPTLTPLPTIPPEQRGQTYADLMSNNGGCELPCWWGFEMGVTSLQEVRQFYASFDTYMIEENEQDGISIHYFTFIDPQIEYGSQVRHTFIAQDGIVIEAEIEVVFDQNYQIKPLLQRLGLPSEVWMWTIPEAYEGGLPAYFLLYFPEQGVLVNHATGGSRIDDTVNICFDVPGGTIVHLWDPSIWNPDGDKGFVERTSETIELTLQTHRPIDEVSNWGEEQLYTVLVNPTHTECLKTTANLWPVP